MATIFNRQDFIERSRHFVPVYVDGDAPNAQKEGARFKVSGYPTMVLFTPDGTEITRLPGEVDADQYMRVLAMGMNGARPVKATLAAALAAGAAGRDKLAPEDWRMLAYYSWVTDEQQLDAAEGASRRRSRGSPRRVLPIRRTRRRASSCRRWPRPRQRQGARRRRGSGRDRIA